MKDIVVNRKFDRGLMVILFMLPLVDAAFAGGIASATTTGVVTTFFDSIKTLLVSISVVVIAIAIIFAGYQIAFNNKRITEVMPVLIGGLVVGLGTALATFLVQGTM
jgi:type IV secretion system protein VirB2